MCRLRYVTRALCDPGSQVSFAKTSLVDRLKLPRSPVEIAVQGIGALRHAPVQEQVTLSLRSTRSSFAINIKALVTITSSVPDSYVNVSQWKHLAGIPLADKHFGTPGAIDVLLGADVWGHLVQSEVIHGQLHEPHAQRMQLGWVVFGPAVLPPPQPIVRTHNVQRIPETATDFTLDELVKNFWKLEEVPLDDSREDECSRLFDSTHSRSPEGRYMVQIPVRHDAPKLGASYRSAVRQFYSLERRLYNNPGLREKYITFMREYEGMGYMERVGQHGDLPNSYYIPHHAVITKFRVVFNASAKTTSGVSFNDIQLVGPTIQDSLINVILRFQRYPVALTADVEKMFHQVLVAPQHRDFQRILWRESPSDELNVFRLTTVTYGMASSPYTSVRSMMQCAQDNQHLVRDPSRSRAAREAIEKSFYVDDLLTSCSSQAEAVRLAADIHTVLLAGHFKLRKWNSNCAKVIDRVSHNVSFPSSSTELVIECPTATVLGLRWDPTADELFFLVELEPVTTPSTKRRVLSEVAQLFDPTGLLAPVVIVGKMFIQTLWSAGITWDAPLTDPLQTTWQMFRDGLTQLNRVRIPRWLGMHSQQSTTIHGFCDASSRAYAAVIYLRTTYPNDRVEISLVTARTKVAPIKGATIPCLELCAAHLLAATFDNIRTALGLTAAPYYLWSDSSIVLCLLRKEPSKLKPYIANRVRQVQELTSPGRWHHVRSAQNPADCASRGIGASDLVNHNLWWQGPEWLKSGSLPLGPAGQPDDADLVKIAAELKTTFITGVTVMKLQLMTRCRDGTIIPLVERFSNLPKLLHVIAYMTRWLKPHRHLMQLPVIGADELDDALQRLIRIEQAMYFPQEIHQLRSESPLASGSPLLSLNPYLDHQGLLRVGGRLTHSSLTHDQKFPFVLPKTGHLVELLIDHTHKTTMHGGAQFMLQTLRRKHWILQGWQAVRSFVHKCVICRRQEVRTTVKGYLYLAIFVCMATKAVHIEVIEDLTTQAFMDAFTRFTSRRGVCPDLYSDNGTAFVGANRLMKEDLVQFQSQYNQQALAHAGTRWHFITPGAPHQGGLWEAAVKSAKHHLTRLVGSQSLWYNQLHTLATRIEACLNSRPLVPLHDDPDDKLALTPGDFLIGSPLIAVPEPPIEDVPLNRLKQYQWLRKVHQDFWQGWTRGT